MPMPFPVPDGDAPMYICMPMTMPAMPMPPVVAPEPEPAEPVEEPGMIRTITLLCPTANLLLDIAPEEPGMPHNLKL